MKSTKFPLQYSSKIGFLGCEHFLKPSPKKPKFAIIGLPFDGAVTNRKGAKEAPNAIRKASLMLCDAYHPYIKTGKKNISPIFPKCKITDLGDLKIPTAGNTSIEKMQEIVKTNFTKNLANHHLCALGGDHSLTLPILRAHFARTGKALALIHFDAHCDTWDNHYDKPSGHGTWVYEAHKEGLINIKKTIQIGIRSSGEAKTINYVANNGGKIFTGKDLREVTGKTLKPIIQQIKKIIDKNKTYLSIDIDCLDPAFAPGTGTPEPAGLTSSQALSLIESFTKINFVGMDLVEVNPAYDHAELTSLTAAHIVWTYICLQLAK